MALSDNRPLHKRHHKAKHPLWKTEMEISVAAGLVLLAVLIVLLFNLLLPPPALFVQADPSGYGHNDTVSAIAAQGHNTSRVYVLVTTASGNTITMPSVFNTRMLAAGTYKLVAYDANDGRYSGSETLIITRGFPELELSGPSSHNFNGQQENVSFSISSQSDQVDGTLYLNGIGVANTASSGSYSMTPDPGVYNITIASQATRNYSATSKSIYFSIYPNIIFNTSQNLTSNVNVRGNVTVTRGTVLTLNGHSIVAGGTFINYGAVSSGLSDSGGRPQRSVNPYIKSTIEANATGGASFPLSYGGGGGAGSGCASYGGNTIARGGSYVVTGIRCTMLPGLAPPVPEINADVIASWYANGIDNYTAGGGGGGGEGSHYASGGPGGKGAYGVFIQANRLLPGRITADGQNGSDGITGLVGSGGGGGGGGAMVLLAYGPGGYTKGNYSVNGGIGGTGGINSFFYGGNGIAGQVLVYNFTTPPVEVCSGVCLGSDTYP